MQKVFQKGGKILFAKLLFLDEKSSKYIFEKLIQLFIKCKYSITQPFC
jgi:hypothetical protein